MSCCGGGAVPRYSGEFGGLSGAGRLAEVARAARLGVSPNPAVLSCPPSVRSPTEGCLGEEGRKSWAPAQRLQVGLHGRQASAELMSQQTDPTAESSLLSRFKCPSQAPGASMCACVCAGRVAEARGAAGPGPLLRCQAAGPSASHAPFLGGEEARQYLKSTE